MSTELHPLIEAIHTSGYKAVVVASGGGSGAIHSLLSHPGASRFILEAQIPYSMAAMISYLGAAPEQACSEIAARQMMQRAFGQAHRLLPKARPLAIVCTAALRTKRDRRGTDRVFIGIKTEQAEQMFKLNFIAEQTREEQEETLSRALLLLIAKVLELDVDMVDPEGVECSTL